MSFLKLENLEKKYSANGPVIVKKINLEIKEGEFVVFLGPSGCGKTTIIRMIAGLEDVTGGDIKVNGESIINELPRDRGVSMIFQSYAVWPHMTVYGNIAYPLKLRKMSKKEIDVIVKEVAESTQLSEYLDRYPNQLSGGQRQRVAVARAMVVKPRIFLMDEPLSNLDAKLRVSMRTELKKIHEKIGSTSIFVTHDQSEAMSLADKIVVLYNGNIEQVGTPSEVYHKNKSVFVASFIGSPPTNFFETDIVSENDRIVAKNNSIHVNVTGENAALLERYIGKTVKMGIRPENFTVSKLPLPDYFAKAKVVLTEPQGSHTVYILDLDGVEIKVVVYSVDCEIGNGDTIYLSTDCDRIGFFDMETEKRIEEEQIFDYLKELYPSQYRDVYHAICNLIKKYDDGAGKGVKLLSEKDVMLITYADTIVKENEKPLVTQGRFAEKYLKNHFSAIHFLPIYPFSSDDGFSVIDYRKVREELGEWEDVAGIKARGFDIMLDTVANHCSAQSDYAKGYLNGDEKYRDYFIDTDSNADVSKVIRPRTLPLLTQYQAQDGSVKNLWTTFSSDQLDFNYGNPNVFLEILDIMLNYAKQGASFIRLDAIGLIWKEFGTKCMHLPQTHKLIKILRQVLDRCFAVKIITETNVPHEDNIGYFGNGKDEAGLVYQFPLPPLTMYSLLTGNASYLTQWVKTLDPEMKDVAFLNFLASHDGIGVRPVENVLSKEELQHMIEHARAQGGEISYRNLPDGSAVPYELNITYLDAVTNADDDNERKTKKFLAAHSILLALAGMPAIYIHSLLGSRSDLKGMKQSGINRRINRETLQYDSIAAELKDVHSLRHGIYKGLTDLIDKRTGCTAFAPSARQEVLDFGSEVFALRRTSDREEILYAVNVSDKTVSIPVGKSSFDLISNSKIEKGNYNLQPYQFVWLK